MRLRQAELTILNRGSKGGEIHQKAIWFEILLRNIITTLNHHKEDLMVACEIMSRCIAFGSTVVSSYAQSNNSTSEKKNLIMMPIQP
jgi:hypothetical protein